MKTTSTADLQIFKNVSAHLLSDKKKIKEIWEQKVRENIFASGEQNSLTLQNSIDVFMNELIENFKNSSKQSPYDVVMRGMAKKHGGQRALFSGYFLPQLLKEFSILRDVILEDLEDSHLLTYKVTSITNSAIDSSVSSAAAEFALVQQENIQSALDKAKASNVELEQFASVAAHDLKSPLATIAGYLDLLEEDLQENQLKDSINHLRTIRKASGRMNSLIDHLLDYARLTKSEDSFTLVALDKVLAHAIENLQEVVGKTRTEIIHGPLPTIYGDPQLLLQVFQNLIANSIKFCGTKSPRIQISARNDQDGLLITFKDHGIGFESKYSEEIFVLYKKLHGSNDFQGTGIGLATCRKVMELHGGKIWANSNPGQGSTFCMMFPPPPTSTSLGHH